jgi:zinc protease
MKKVKWLWIILISAITFYGCNQSKYQVKTTIDKNGYSYESVTNDPLGVRVYTLKNGLKVYFTVVKDAPRIQTLISVRAGSIEDPVETTGLAHYFEHMLFKGTSNFGTTDWSKENVILSQISDLFEKKRQATDSVEKAKIYKQIDKLSIEASKYAIPNEYDKLMNAIGGQGTNAFTNPMATTYMEDIPSNEIDRWLKLQYERFNHFALRLFHTELETVYEEFNMSQDQDGNRAYESLMSGLFPTFPLGRSVLGLPEHLKNPSMVNIMNFFKTYYVPNNMAVIMSGDFDMDQTIPKIDSTFGQLAAKPFEKPVYKSEEPIDAPVTREVFGPDADFLQMGFRFRGDSSDDKKYVTLIDNMLNNAAAGLIDLDLVQQQKVLRAGSYPDFYKEYGIHNFYGNPREGQSLEEVKNLLLGELDKIKKGDFEDWLMKAVVNDLRLQFVRSQERYQSRAFTLVTAFMKEGTRLQDVKFLDDLDKITKEDLVKFANENYRDNYVVVYKRKGEAKNIVKMPKPVITPIDINRTEQSAFYTSFVSEKPARIQPVFIDYQKEMQKKELKPGIDLYYIPNKTNELFSLMYVIDMGKSHNKKLALGVGYLPYVGTDKYTPAQLQQEFFKLGVRFSVNTGEERSYVSLTGLNTSLDQGAGLLEHLLTHAKGDTSSYKKYVDGIVKERANNKLNKDFILYVALSNYGQYGKNSAFTDIIQEKEMRTINPDELTGLVKDLGSYKHRIVYYGNSDINTASGIITARHPLPEKAADIPKPLMYAEAPVNSKEVYFIGYDMVQSNFLWLEKIGRFDAAILPYVQMYNEYYSTIVFQEIREARGMAYSAGSWISSPDKKDRSFFKEGYAATQADKFTEASSTLLGLMNNMKEDQLRFGLAKESILNGIETGRITKTSIFWNFLNNQDLGIDHDNRKEIYEKVQSFTIDDLKKYFDDHKSGNYTLLVIGKKGSVDEKAMKKLGTYKELSLEEIFNY